MVSTISVPEMNVIVTRQLSRAILAEWAIRWGEVDVCKGCQESGAENVDLGERGEELNTWPRDVIATQKR